MVQNLTFLDVVRRNVRSQMQKMSANNLMCLLLILSSGGSLMQLLMTCGGLRHVDFPLRVGMLVLQILIKMLMSSMVTGQFLMAFIWMAFLKLAMEGNTTIS